MRTHFRRIRTGDDKMERIQDNIDASFRPIESSDVIDGVLVSDVVLTSSKDNLVSHGLGRKPKMWLLANKDANSTIWSPASTQLLNKSMNDKYINLWCSTNCKVTLWVA